MSRSWRSLVALVLVFVPLLVVVPGASAAPLNVTCNGGACSGGWYQSDVGVDFQWDTTDPSIVGTSGCGPFQVASDTSGVTFTCTLDRPHAQPSDQLSVTVRRDATPPSVSVALSRGPDSSGWYNHPVDFVASGSDNLSGVASCSSGTFPDSSVASCTDNAGNTASVGVGANYDATGPSIDSVSFDRPPDSDGWYNHPVQIAFHGSDDGSGVASCSSVSYAGPDTSGTTVNGSCRDNAGNTTGGTSPAFKYDTKPPTLTNVRTDWDDGTATLSWTASADTKRVVVERAPGKDGAATSTVYTGLAKSFQDTGLQNKVKYVYTISGFDDAGNNAVDSVSIVPGAKLYSPARGTSVKSPPLLAWRRYRGATYYNVQLWRAGGRKILSVWPLHAHYRLSKAWQWNEKRRALARGHYRWYVYPGLGKPSANKYGPLIGASDFFVVKR